MIALTRSKVDVNKELPAWVIIVHGQTNHLLDIVKSNFGTSLVKRGLATLEASGGRVALLVTKAAELSAPGAGTSTPSPALHHDWQNVEI